MAIKVNITSLGCNKNLVDAERMLYDIKQAGFEIVTEPGLSDVAIVNTCGFIQSAKEEAIETILELITLKNEGRIKSVIITGCLSERYREEAAELFVEADAVIGIGDNKDIVEIINATLKNQRVIRFGSKYDLALSGKRIITTLPFFAYVKIAEGCSNCCSYCAIPAIRGKYRSVPMEKVIEEVNWLCDNGVTEIILTAQDTTRYGEDLYGECRLPELMNELCKIENLKWMRILYCYPEKVSDELIKVMKNQEKVVKYLDIPIQHCNDRILKLMNRRCDKASLNALFEKLRREIPEITLRTTLITGFPTETDEEFEELCHFVKDIEFDKLGCFAYSEEEGTKAETFEQVDEEIRTKRAEIIMDMQNVISEQKNADMLGKTVVAVVEGFDRYSECFFGRTAADAPDIDGKIFFTCDKKLKLGQYVNVNITDTLEYDLIGEAIL